MRRYRNRKLEFDANFKLFCVERKKEVGVCHKLKFSTSYKFTTQPPSPPQKKTISAKIYSYSTVKH